MIGVEHNIILLHELLTKDEIRASPAVSTELGNDAVLYTSLNAPNGVLVQWDQLCSCIHAERATVDCEVKGLHACDGGRGNDNEASVVDVEVGSGNGL